MTIDTLSRIITDTRQQAAARRDALGTMITRANGGTPPDRVMLRLAGDPPAPPEVDTLTVTYVGDGRSSVEVGIATHWTRLRYPNFRCAVTPGSQIVLLGRDGGGAMHVWLEDGRLHLDRGSPLRSAAAEAEAIAAFDAAVADLVAEAR